MGWLHKPDFTPRQPHRLRILSEKLCIFCAPKAPGNLGIHRNRRPPRENERGHGQQREGEDLLQARTGKPLPKRPAGEQSHSTTGDEPRGHDERNGLAAEQMRENRREAENPRQRASAARSEVPPEAGSCEGAPGRWAETVC